MRLILEPTEVAAGRGAVAREHRQGVALGPEHIDIQSVGRHCQRYGLAHAGHAADTVLVELEEFQSSVAGRRQVGVATETDHGVGETTNGV